MIIPQEEAKSLARHVLTGFGLLLVQLGVLQQVGIVESMAGAAAILVGAIWVILDKREVRAKEAAVPPHAAARIGQLERALVAAGQPIPAPEGIGTVPVKAGEG